MLIPINALQAPIASEIFRMGGEILSIAGAFAVRIPVAWLISQTQDPTLFEIGLATPASTFVQIVLCVTVFTVLLKKEKKQHV